MDDSEMVLVATGTSSWRLTGRTALTLVVGNSAPVVLTITNGGAADATVVIRVLGAPAEAAGWVRLPVSPLVAVAAGASADVEVTVAVPASAAPGPYAVTFTAAPTGDGADAVVTHVVELRARRPLGAVLADVPLAGAPFDATTVVGSGDQVLLVANRAPAGVMLVDTVEGTVVGSLAIPGDPVVFAPDGRRSYAMDRFDGVTDWHIGRRDLDLEALTLGGPVHGADDAYMSTGRTNATGRLLYAAGYAEWLPVPVVVVDTETMSTFSRLALDGWAFVPVAGERVAVFRASAQGDMSVVVVDGRTGSEVAIIAPVVEDPRVMLAHDDRPWLHVGSGAGVQTLDVDAGYVVSTVPVGGYVLALACDGDRLYAATRSAVVVVDVLHGDVLGIAPLGPGRQPDAVAVTPGSRRAAVLSRVQTSFPPPDSGGATFDHFLSVLDVDC